MCITSVSFWSSSLNSVVKNTGLWNRFHLTSRLRAEAGPGLGEWEIFCLNLFLFLIEGTPKHMQVQEWRQESSLLPRGWPTFFGMCGWTSALRGWNRCRSRTGSPISAATDSLADRKFCVYINSDQCLDFFFCNSAEKTQLDWIFSSNFKFLLMCVPPSLILV